MNDTLNKILRHPATVPVAIGVLCFGGGLAAGLILGNRSAWKKATPMLQEKVDEEVQEIKERRRVVIDEAAFKESQRPKPEIDVETHIRRKLEGGPHPPEEEEPSVVTHNVFAQDDGDWDYEEEKKKRSSDAPYILHRDEFFAKEMPGFAQKTFTYWAGDDTLANDEARPVPIYNRDQVVGDDDNLRFGHGSGEEHVVYIRNEQRGEEYEVLREEGMYAVEKMGWTGDDEDELRHSTPQKFPRQE